MYLCLKVIKAETSEQFFTAVDDLLDVIDIAGCASLIRFDKKIQLVQAMKKFIIFDRMNAASNQ